MAGLAYPDLENPEDVFESLLGYGIFTDKLPPCFSSKGFLTYVKEANDELAIPTARKKQGYAAIQYLATRNNNTPRQLAIPHPEAYWDLCVLLKEYWNQINEHIGRPTPKVNYCHIRRCKGAKCIFKMNYSGSDKWRAEELELDYALGSRYVVNADISNFFPSIYSHSLPWALKGKEWAKKHRCSHAEERQKASSGVCRFNDGSPCPHTEDDLWGNRIDVVSRRMKENETNGLLIGPHTSNIVSEIILSSVDSALQNKGYLKLIRYIDDFTFYARDEQQAQAFLRDLSCELKKYELTLNTKKTRIIAYHDYVSTHWKSLLNQHSFPDREQLGFTSVGAYLDLAFNLAQENQNYAVLNYAIQVISKKQLSARAKRLYVKKILQLTLEHNYLLPLLEKYVFPFADESQGFLGVFLKRLFFQAIGFARTDSLAFVFYFAIRYDVVLSEIEWDGVIALDDCISLLLGYKYCVKKGLSLEPFEAKKQELKAAESRDQDKFWLFMYETMPSEELDGFLCKLKEANVEFVYT
ncbi:MAG: RNA-directed DNA polymerase [Desulfovibrio sp.]